MKSLQTEAIQGFNKFLAEQRALPDAAKMTVVLFDQNVQIIANAVPLQHVEPLTTETYAPDGLTALHDAVGKAIAGLNARAPKKATICILTDGIENASHEYNASMIKGMIAGCEARGWKVIFLAANQDAFVAGDRYGVLRTATANVPSGTGGISTAFAALSTANATYRTLGTVDLTSAVDDTGTLKSS